MYLLNHARNRTWVLLSLLCIVSVSSLTGESIRRVESLNRGWKTFATEDSKHEPAGISEEAVATTAWKDVDIPHNWDRYQGFRQAKHGNFHGSAWYRREFQLQEADRGRRIFLFFEGVGSYATVWVNGQLAGKHAGGLTTFTLDITQHVNWEENNLLVVRADHPAGIRDLPWVCGGCELAYGFSEGTQPFGISRPVSLVVTDPLRIEPFGIHIWNDQNISQERAQIHVRSEIKNYATSDADFTLRTTLLDPQGTPVFVHEENAQLGAGESTLLEFTSAEIDNPQLWSPDQPHLHSLHSELFVDGNLVDRTVTQTGIRWIEWPDLNGPEGQPLRINGQPFFINGVADYEHVLGESHAFSEQQIQTRVGQIQAAGFNAFRDAHHPHNLRFNKHWDQTGMLWWTQFGAHIWFPNPEFIDNYKTLLKDWIRERRNSPSLFLYGLQNESKLPLDFTKECLEIIRSMDPTASTQRLVTTCNGGKGTDWDVPQNWSGTYGGNLNAYSTELRTQRMVGEYGAWRSLERHSEGGFVEDGPLSEDRMAALMETKVRLAEEVREEVIGHFAWPFVTHQNPGRNVGSRGQQSHDGVRVLDRIGPANNKGLLTIWGEPLDVFYMYRSNYADPATEPMVYIVSHTWPDRWTEPGVKNEIIVYSNCDEVELFNDYKTKSLGTRTREGRGTHFRWDNVPIQWNTLYAEGRINGEVVATDIIQLHHLPAAPVQTQRNNKEPNLLRGLAGQHYLYRVNAGGPDYVDTNGVKWSADRMYSADRKWGSLSWDRQYSNLPEFFGSKRRIFDPVGGTRDDPLLQSFRYGRDELAYLFDVPNGRYTIELFFTEPWYGTGGGLDCTGWRSFDVALNGSVVLDDLDIWKQVGHASALRKVVTCEVQDGRLEISFPGVNSWQAVISAIAVSTNSPVDVKDVPAGLIQDLQVADPVRADKLRIRSWLDTGDSRTSDTLDSFVWIPWELREADWIQVTDAAAGTESSYLLSFDLAEDATVYVAHAKDAPRPDWLASWNTSDERIRSRAYNNQGFALYYQHASKGERLVMGSNGSTTAPMYSVFVTRRYPPPPPNGILDFSVSGSVNTSGWQPAGHLRTGRGLYADDSAPIAAFSSRLSDADWIRTDPADANNPDVRARLRFTDHVEVFVLMDPAIETLPDWIEGWIASEWQLTTGQPHNKRYTMRWKRFAPGDWIELGPNGTAVSRLPEMYGVILRTVKPDRLYEAEALSEYASLISKSQADWTGSGYLDLSTLEATDFAWIIEVGVGDRYNINMRYQLDGDAMELPLSIIAEDGTVVCTDSAIFPPTGNVWELLRYRTCDSINAGTYRIVLHGNATLKRLRFDSVTVE
jgi:hypothetical protein